MSSIIYNQLISLDIFHVIIMVSNTSDGHTHGPDLAREVKFLAQ
jgi:hypothetical protein